MKKQFVMVSLLVATNAMALDFETEWAKFKDDFARLRPTITKVTPEPEVKPIVTPVEDGEVKQVDPKSPDRLGLKLSDSSMVQKMKELYANPNTVVYSATVR